MFGGVVSGAYWLGHATALHNQVPSSVPVKDINTTNSKRITASSAPTILPSDRSVCKKPTTQSPVQWAQCTNLELVSKNPPPPSLLDLVDVFLAKRVQLAYNLEQGKLNLVDFNVELSQLGHEFNLEIDKKISDAQERSIRSIASLPQMTIPSTRRSVHCSTIDTGISRNTDCY